MPVIMNCTPRARVISPKILVSTSRPVSPRCLKITGAYLKVKKMMKVIIMIAAIKGKFSQGCFWAVSAKRMMVDIVPAPVVRGIAMGMMAVDILFEKLRSGDSMAFFTVLIIPNPVLSRSKPPAILKAGTLISKKFRTASPTNMEITMVMKLASVAVLQMLLLSILVWPFIRLI